MSRIGLKPITLPAGVEVKVDDKNLVSVKGPKGELQEKVSSLLTVENKDGVVTVSRSSDAAEHRAQHGLARTLINNMVKGVTEGYEKKLLLVGVGYKAEKTEVFHTCIYQMQDLRKTALRTEKVRHLPYLLP